VSRPLFASIGGTLDLPDRGAVLVDAADGGHLIVNPPRPVWERSELGPAELSRWSFLVAAAGRAMLDLLPPLTGGCVNYWEAGNWSLHVDAERAGTKSPERHRRVHLHLLGRSPHAASPDLRWGEAPRFPDFAERHAWAKKHRRLDAESCAAIVARVEALLRERYGFGPTEIAPWTPCVRCELPMPRTVNAAGLCAECAREVA
jgi:diadenosine tetraphosphate (Ap4A) HIT family hydrolase